jgi:hypothetical protein
MIDAERCRRVVNSIRDLSKTEIDELFKLLYKDNCEYTQNNNGIFFNLSWVSEDTMTKIEQFIEFCNQSKMELTRYETLCHTLYDDAKEPKKPKHHVARVQQAAPDVETEAEAEEDADVRKGGTTRVSSSMRFYLLKKRFSKPPIPMSSSENDLMAEPYLL